jgi:hypothetical protein
LLIDNWTRDYVPPVAIIKNILNRGESLTRGTGLGLDMAKRIAKGHNGVIIPHRTAEGGAGIRIILPNTESRNPEERSRLVAKYLEIEYSQRFQQTQVT